MKGENMVANIDQFQDDISAMHENAETILKRAEKADSINQQSILSFYSLILKGQAVLGEIMLEVLKSQNEKP